MVAAPSARIVARASTPRPILDAASVVDRARRFLLRRSGALARTLVLPRERRVAAAGVLGVVVALVFGVWAPLPLLAFGPLFLGVPHLVSDARYLVVRPGFHRRPLALAAGAVAILGLVMGLGVRAGLLAAIVAALGGQGSFRRRFAVAACAGVLFACAARAPFEADVVFFHLHNVVAIGLWLAWRRRKTRLHWLIVSSFIAASLFIGFGSLPAAPYDAHWTGLSFGELARTLSFASDPSLTYRLVLFFAFAQSVHYVVWLRLIPDEDRKACAPRSYVQSARALTKDLGGPLLWGALLLLVGLLGLAIVRLELARDAYLGVAYAHGHLELVAAAILATEGMRSA